MNIYYLKKFRKWAKEFVKIYANEYKINRYDVRAGVVCDDRCHTMDEAKRILIMLRRDFILKWCRERKREKLNKQLAKL